LPVDSQPARWIAEIRAVLAVGRRVGSRLPPTVARKNGGSGLMVCERADP
jgi:hypothetical protein